jgi:type IX secretion system PorP/SprF family membrane protein
MRAITLLFLCGLLCSARAQQISQYTQYVFNQFSVNPAVAGSKDCLDVRLGFRKQWVGFPGAPTTGWASLHGYLRAKGKPYVKNRHGIGAFVEADDAGALGYTHFYLAYAYHIQMAKDYYISLGLFAGVKQVKFNGSLLNGLVDPTDPVLKSNGSSMTYPMIWPGVWMYSKNGWLGLSIPQVLNNKIPGLGVNSTLTPHFLMSAGRRIRLNKRMGLVPSTMLKLSPKSPLAFDLNFWLEYKRKLGVGITYRNQDAVAFLVKIPLMKFFSVGYSYDINTSRLRVANSNTHEIILSIYPCGADDPAKAIVRCPVFE